MTIISLNPARDYEVLGEVPISTKSEVVAKYDAARAAFGPWAAMELRERIKLLSKVPEIVARRLEDLAKLSSLEMGMPISQSRFMVQKSINHMRWSLDNAEASLAPEITYETDTEINEVIHVPHGVVAAISPWNFPVSNFIWACFQNLIAGNTIVFKTSEEVQLSAKEIEKLFDEVSLPAGVFNVIYGDGEVAQHLINCDIDHICFTGSTKIGQILYRQAAEKFIPAVLEMGGSDPAVVFADADLDEAAQVIYAGRFSNCGQICCAVKRLIVHESVHDELVSKLEALIKSKIIGDPLDDKTDIGPLAAKRQLDTLQDQVNDAVEKGAKLISAGPLPEELKGAYVMPALLTNVTRDMKVWHEELFGPILAITSFSTFDEAIEKANDTIYGLGASVYTTDTALAAKACTAIQSGMVRVNTTIYSRPSNPFGGIKKSGIGRVNSKVGFHEATRVKVVARVK